MFGMTMNQILMTDRAETYEEWVSDKESADAVKNACILKDYDPTGEATAELIKEWFFDYRIGWKDPVRFRRYHTRTIAACMPQYKELLRTQPGVGVQLDYLVSDYRERQADSKGTTNSTQTHGNDVVNSTKNGTNDSTTQYSSGTTNIRTGGTTSTKTGIDTTDRSGIETDVQGKVMETNSPHVQKVTKTDNDHSEWAGNESLQSTLPMSKKYDKFIEVTPDTDDKQYYEKAFQHMPSGGLDWTTASAQAQDGHRGYGTDDNKVTESYIYGDGVKGDIRTTEGDSKNPSEKKNIGNDKTTYNTTDGLVYDNLTDKSNHTGSNNVSATSGETGITTSTYGNIDNVTDASNRDREIVKGRNSAPQELLEKAKSYIVSSNAWLWLREQLEPCFDPSMED